MSRYFTNGNIRPGQPQGILEHQRYYPSAPIRMVQSNQQLPHFSAPPSVWTPFGRTGYNQQQYQPRMQPAPQSQSYSHSAQQSVRFRPVTPTAARVRPQAVGIRSTIVPSNPQQLAVRAPAPSQQPRPAPSPATSADQKRTVSKIVAKPKQPQPGPQIKVANAKASGSSTTTTTAAVRQVVKEHNVRQLQKQSSTVKTTKDVPVVKVSNTGLRSVSKPLSDGRASSTANCSWRWWFVISLKLLTFFTKAMASMLTRLKRSCADETVRLPSHEDLLTDIFQSKPRYFGYENADVSQLKEDASLSEVFESRHATFGHSSSNRALNIVLTALIICFQLATLLTDSLTTLFIQWEKSTDHGVASNARSKLPDVDSFEMHCKAKLKLLESNVITVADDEETIEEKPDNSVTAATNTNFVTRVVTRRPNIAVNAASTSSPTTSAETKATKATKIDLVIVDEIKDTEIDSKSASGCGKRKMEPAVNSNPPNVKKGKCEDDCDRKTASTNQSPKKAKVEPKGEIMPKKEETPKKAEVPKKEEPPKKEPSPVYYVVDDDDDEAEGSGGLEVEDYGGFRVLDECGADSEDEHEITTLP